MEFPIRFHPFQEPDLALLLGLMLDSDWSGLERGLRSHWSAVCPAVFPPKADPCDLAIDDAAAKHYLLDPITALACGEIDEAEDRSIDSQSLTGLATKIGMDLSVRAGQVCGKVFRAGELTYTCRCLCWLIRHIIYYFLIFLIFFTIDIARDPLTA